MEAYLVNGQLVEETIWKRFIKELREEIQEENNLDLLKKKIEIAVLQRAHDSIDAEQKIGLFFSGGVDSTLIGFILKKNGIPFTCYTVGFQDAGTKEPEDITESKKIAKELGFEQKIIMLDLNAADLVFKESAEILRKIDGATGHPVGGAPRPATASHEKNLVAKVASDAPSIVNVVTLGVGGVVLAAAKEAKKDDITHFFGGLGSEELFAGYQRHDTANTDEQALQEECWNGLLGMWSRDLVRDCALAGVLSIVVHTPFLDPSVIRAGMAIPASEKIKEQKGEQGGSKLVKKYCLRVVAEELGLPKAYAWRPKRAAQYGSRLDSALDKLAKRAGLGKKSEYIVQILKQ